MSTLEATTESLDLTDADVDELRAALSDLVAGEPEKAAPAPAKMTSTYTR